MINPVYRLFSACPSADLRYFLKRELLADFNKYIGELKKTRAKPIISGDYDVRTKAAEMSNRVSGKSPCGFLTEERAEVSQFLE